jgi:hypothetical protein
MVAMDLIRFAALISIPAAFALGRLSFAQLLVVSVVVGAANIAFRAASGAFLKTLVRPEDLLVADGRFESTTWHQIAPRCHSLAFKTAVKSALSRCAASVVIRPGLLASGKIVGIFIGIRGSLGGRYQHAAQRC